MGDLFERTFGRFFARYEFKSERVSQDDDPRGSAERFMNEDFQVRLHAERSFTGDRAIVSVFLCPASGPDNLGWILAERVLTHVASQTIDSEDIQAIASAMDSNYELLKAFFHEDDGYSGRWHLLQAFGNTKWVFVAPSWSDRTEPK